MALSSNELDSLIDVVENKLSTMMIHDREDMREVKMLKRCVDKLKAMKGSAEAIVAASDVLDHAVANSRHA